jgi:hypothetical protein
MVNAMGSPDMRNELPFRAESDVESLIMSNPEFLEGIWWGKPRGGHPEGAVAFHVAEVLQNIDQMKVSPHVRGALREIALVHDTFKNQVDLRLPKSGKNHHGARARAFLAKVYSEWRHLTADPWILQIIEKHDDAYNAWQLASRRRRPFDAEERAARLIEKLGPNLDLYLKFFRADSETGSKSLDPFAWFLGITKMKPELDK